MHERLCLSLIITGQLEWDAHHVSKRLEQRVYSKKTFLKKKKKNKKSFLNALSVLLSHNHRVSAFKSVCKLSTNVREPQTGNRILVGLRTVCFSCSSLCYAAVINVMTESNLGKKGLFGLQVLITVHH